MSSTYLSQCRHCTFPIEHCICEQGKEITIPSSINIHLLFHPRELEKRNSTGRLLKHCCDIPSSKWHRLKNQQQSQAFTDFGLLYPADDAIPLSSDAMENHKGLLIIDGTWQESQKMLRQSPWLNTLPKYRLMEPDLNHKLSAKAHCNNKDTSNSNRKITSSDLTMSQFQLRRNQKDNGLCTLEAFALSLKALGHTQSCQDLLQFLQIFQSRYLDLRQAGLLK